MLYSFVSLYVRWRIHTFVHTAPRSYRGRQSGALLHKFHFSLENMGNTKFFTSFMAWVCMVDTLAGMQAGHASLSLFVFVDVATASDMRPVSWQRISSPLLWVRVTMARSQQSTSISYLYIVYFIDYGVYNWDYFLNEI